MIYNSHLIFNKYNIMKIFEVLAKKINEDATGGATSTGSVATSLGSGAGFGKSIFMRRVSTPKKKSKR